MVTGASSGIGRELAYGLAARGYALLLVARRTQRLEQTAGRLREDYGVDVTVWECDLGSREQRAQLAAELRSRHVSVLCNNAGFATFGPLAHADSDHEASEVAVNVVAVHELTLAVLPGMIARDEGAILLTGSTAGLQPVPSAATYCATKSFVNTFAEALSGELRGTNVTCTLLAPGPVRTEFFAVAGVGAMESITWWLAWQPPERVAKAALDAMARGRRVVTPGPVAKLQAAAGLHIPRTILLPVLSLAMPLILRFSSRARTRA